MSKLKIGPIELKEGEKFGRYLVATQNISAGKLIFKESPICFCSNFRKKEISELYFTCISCFRVLKKTKAVLCKYCNWLFCSRRCSKDSWHRQLECGVLTKNEILPSKKRSRYLFMLRLFCLKEKDKSKWEHILELSSKMVFKNPDDNERHNRACIVAHNFVKTICKMNVSLSEVKELVNILDINRFSFEEKSLDKNRIKKWSTALYSTASMISNSCAPNAEWCCHPGKKEERCTIAIISCKDISAGEMITISYRHEYNFNGSHDRRACISDHSQFLCECGRCEDPTELGTYFSALKCPFCSDGWTLPNPRSQQTRFECENCGGWSTREALAIEKSFKKNMNVVKKLSTKYREKYLDDLITNGNMNFKLHPNHHLIIEANEQWLASLDYEMLTETTLESERLFHKIIERTQQNLAMANVFGNVIRKVEYHSLIALATAGYYFKGKRFAWTNKDLQNLNWKIAVIEIIVKHLRASLDIGDPSLFGNKTKEMIAATRKRYNKWNSRLTRCRSKSLKLNIAKK